MLPALAVGGMLAGTIASHVGGQKAAKQQAAAVAGWQRRKQAALDAQGKNDYDQALMQQKARGDYLGMLSSTMGAPASVAPTTAGQGVHQTATGGRDTAWEAVANARTPMAGVQDAILAQVQSGMDRKALMRALQQLGYTTQNTAQAQATEYGRKRFLTKRKLAALDAEMAGFQPSNGAFNMQALGGLLSGLGQAGLMASSMGGGDVTGVGGVGNGSRLTGMSASELAGAF